MMPVLMMPVFVVPVFVVPVTGVVILLICRRLVTVIGRPIDRC